MPAYTALFVCLGLQSLISYTAINAAPTFGAIAFPNMLAVNASASASASASSESNSTLAVGDHANATAGTTVGKSGALTMVNLFTCSGGFHPPPPPTIPSSLTSKVPDPKPLLLFLFFWFDLSPVLLLLPRPVPVKSQVVPHHHLLLLHPQTPALWMPRSLTRRLGLVILRTHLNLASCKLLHLTLLAMIPTLHLLMLHLRMPLLPLHPLAIPPPLPRLASFIPSPHPISEILLNLFWFDSFEFHRSPVDRTVYLSLATPKWLH